MTTVKVEARGWIFLLHPAISPLGWSLWMDPIPSTCLLLLLQPSPHFLWTVTRKPFRAPRLQLLANTSINHLLTNEIRLEAHITFENKCLNFLGDKISGLPTLIHCKQFLNKPHFLQTTYVVDFVYVYFRSMTTNEFYTGALSIDEHCRPLAIGFRWFKGWSFSRI